MSKPVPKITHVVAVVVAIAAVVLLFLGGRGGEKRTPNEGSPNEFAGEEPTAGPDVVALLDGLRVGDKLETSTVVAIDAPTERMVFVDLEAGGAVYSVGIARPGARDGGLPPITTDKYEIGYGLARPKDPPPGAMHNAAEVIATRIRKREHEVPVPAGM